MFRKSQAALEFLTTYGWAFLIILIMIGALAYFGILSPTKVLPNRCLFSPELQCLDHQMVLTGAAPNPQLKLRLKNNVGELISVDAGDIVTVKEDGTSLGCAASAAIANWKPGEVQNIALTACGSTGWVAGEKGRAYITVNYYNVASTNTYKKPVKGEVLSAVI